MAERVRGFRRSSRYHDLAVIALIARTESLPLILVMPFIYGFRKLTRSFRGISATHTLDVVSFGSPSFAVAGDRAFGI
jgi:hypothetical protein